MSDIITINTEDAGKYGTTPIQEYTLLELVPENDKILKEKMPDFDFQNPPINPTQLANELVENCKGRNGFGLSANQVGYRYRVFVMGLGEEYIACFNPTIIAETKEHSLITEGCLSFPMLALKISRPTSIQVEYYDFNGEKHETSFEGLTSHIFQHELDHLNGICYTERSKPMALKMGLKKRGKFNKLVDRFNKANKKLTISK